MIERTFRLSEYLPGCWKSDGFWDLILFHAVVFEYTVAIKMYLYAVAFIKALIS